MNARQLISNAAGTYHEPHQSVSDLFLVQTTLGHCMLGARSKTLTVQCTASLPAADIQAVDIEQAEGFVGCSFFCLQAFPEGSDGQPRHCFPNQGQMLDLCQYNAHIWLIMSWKAM